MSSCLGDYTGVKVTKARLCDEEILRMFGLKMAKLKGRG